MYPDYSVLIHEEDKNTGREHKKQNCTTLFQRGDTLRQENGGPG